MNVERRDFAIADTREAIRARYADPEARVVGDLMSELTLSPDARGQIADHGARLVRRVRDETTPSMMESFLDEYGLSTEEGVGLMCLAEALLRTPDAETIDDLIEDKIAASNWSGHLNTSSSPLVNASSWALMLTGRVLDDDPRAPVPALRRAIRRLGEPVIRRAVGQAMKILGQQFVLGETIEDGMRKARTYEAKGYTYSYDMLGEAARTEPDAIAFYEAYDHAIDEIAKRAKGDIRDNPGISVKLSALHPRYQWTHRSAVEETVIPRCLALAKKAAAANIGFNIDAEEQDRLDISLDVIEAVLADPDLAGWDGFGVVVQAYGRRAGPVIEHLHALAEKLDRRIMVRLVKGAYWDTEVKLAQQMGTETFPVFTRKANTDISFMACARMLLDRRDRIFPQFATHNAHTCAAILHMAGNDKDSFEFQRLHGMGQSLHELVMGDEGTRCRIYAPVGAHEDLLAYLVRRLLENGANSSFVNQIVDEDIAPEDVAADPIARVERAERVRNDAIDLPGEVFQPVRRNSTGYRLDEPASVLPLLAAREDFAETTWTAAPVLAEDAPAEGEARDVTSPADPSRVVGQATDATEAEVARALDAAVAGAPDWAAVPVAERATILRKAADLYEARMAEFCAVAAREAGKTLSDGVAEVREAVDFLNYYAAEIERLEEADPGEPLGVFVCVSPWNFPLAIFTGQIAAALAAGNAVLAKPAEQTPLIAALGTALLHEAGVPRSALQVLPGDGATVGGPLTSDPRIAGVCFTGSVATGQRIHRALAENAGPEAVLIAETGGLNAMIVDSTALPEQATQDIVGSAFQSAGQRCSALRMLYIQSDVYDRVLTMLKGAMDVQRNGDPWRIDTDVGPVIDAAAREEIQDYVDAQADAGRVIKAMPAPEGGCYVGPALVELSGIEDLEREVFGPVLHVAPFDADEIDATVDAINAKGYGLTFGVHSRIDDRVEQIVDRIEVGNAYVNRNQIGAIVGSQPFGGEGLSGTGPKAGGPNYVDRFRRVAGAAGVAAEPDDGTTLGADAVSAAVRDLDARNWAGRSDRVAVLRRALRGKGGMPRRALTAAAAFDAGPFDMPGPTGESNRLSMAPKGTVLCLGPGADMALAQATQALAAGCGVVMACPGASEAAGPLREAGAPVAALDGVMAAETLGTLRGIAAVAAAGNSDWTRALRVAAAGRDGALLQVETQAICPARFYLERHVCIDTTAAGGNTTLLSRVE